MPQVPFVSRIELTKSSALLVSSSFTVGLTVETRTALRGPYTIAVNTARSSNGAVPTLWPQPEPGINGFTNVHNSSGTHLNDNDQPRQRLLLDRDRPPRKL
jgi:hypothetical protein